MFFKKGFFLVIIIVLLSMFNSCNVATTENTSDSSLKTDNTGDININVQQKSKVLDSSNNFLGYAVSVDTEGILLYTENEFLVTLLWNGLIEPKSSSFYFSEIDGNGTMYEKVSVEYSEEDHIISSYSKVIYQYNNKYFTYKNATNNTPVFTRGDLLTKSAYIDDPYTGGLHNFEDNDSDVYYSELIEVPVTEIGIPATISTPIRLSFE